MPYDKQVEISTQLILKVDKVLQVFHFPSVSYCLLMALL